jgi:hypothetical protein
MARRRQPLTLQQIEGKLGYTFDYSNGPDNDAIGIFYSDLIPVSKHPYERALKELDEYSKQKTALRLQLLDRGFRKVS